MCIRDRAYAELLIVVVHGLRLKVSCTVFRDGRFSPVFSQPRGASDSLRESSCCIDNVTAHLDRKCCARLCFEPEIRWRL